MNASPPPWRSRLTRLERAEEEYDWLLALGVSPRAAAVLAVQPAARAAHARTAGHRPRRAA